MQNSMSFTFHAELITSESLGDVQIFSINIPSKMILFCYSSLPSVLFYYSIDRLSVINESSIEFQHGNIMNAVMSEDM